MDVDMKNFVVKTASIKVGDRKITFNFMRFFKLFGYEFGWAKLRRDNPQAEVQATGDGKVK